MPSRQDRLRAVRERNLEFRRLPELDENGFRKVFFVGNGLFFLENRRERT